MILKVFFKQNHFKDREAITVNDFVFFIGTIIEQVERFLGFEQIFSKRAFNS